ncbi:hypothetical protein KB575_00575 [Streptococcus canis]|uniref:hypothetical protein n=1 Tax=Streptococcus canis TaxID=1329 RepID=UPI002949425E|nr:hypothetical protein [Streptococcus canis]MDV5987563.1 hypothetical protein [Streptococcus canis]
MAVTVKFDYYSEIFDSYMYGKKFLELPEEIIDAIDDYFDGQEIEAYGYGNPDDVYVNHYYYFTNKNVLLEFDLLSKDEIEHLIEKDQIDDYVESHREEIEERIEDRAVLLGYAGHTWHVLLL